jgi:multisubunit Na+/H+ antiporter MnhG subunit
MWAYPGGTWWNPARSGHSFWENFLCDLLHRTALNSKPNGVGAVVATVALLIFVAGLAVFWSVAAEWLGAPRGARWFVRLGHLGSLLLAAVPLTPSDQFARWHTAAVLLGGLPALATCLWFCAALVRSTHTPRGLRVLSLFLCLLVVTCLGLYAQHAVARGPALRTLPALERIAVATVLIWMLQVLRLPIHLHREPT